MRRREDTRPEGLREPERVSGVERALGEDVVRVHPAGDGEPELRLLVDDGMAAGDDAATFGDLVDGALHEALEGVERQVVGPGHDVQREEDLAAHRVHVRHRVRRGDRAGRVRVVDDRRKEIDRLDDRVIGGNAVYRRVVGRFETDEQLGRVALRGKGAQDLRQWAGAQLRSSAGAGRQGREPDLLACGHGVRIGGAWPRARALPDPALPASRPWTRGNRRRSAGRADRAR